MTGTREDLKRYWVLAREHEAAGNLHAAKAAYEAIVDIDAGHPIAWVRLSEFARQEGRYRSSHACALQAAAAAKANQRSKSLPYVIQQLLGFDERDAIRTLIEGADWSSPQALEQSAVLSQGLWLADHYDSALRLIDYASTQVPPNHLLAYSRGNVLRYLGRMREATDEFERCLSMSPHYAYAHWSLAYHAPSDRPGERIVRIRQAQDALPDDTLDQVYLGYALFKESDDIGDVDQAWAALQLAARAMRRRLDYDPAQEQRGLSALLQATSSVVASRSGTHSGQTPLFIVGMPRSGTTVLDRILGNHSAVASAGELNDFSRALSWEADHFYDVPPSERSTHAAKTVDFSSVGARYLQRTLGRYMGKTHLIDKNPANIFNAGFIAKALPQARIICLLRNPMDTCFSNLKELFSANAFGYSYDLEELADHYLRFRRLVKHWQEMLPGRFHVVEYEALVANPLQTSKEVMQFCGLPFEPGCIDIVSNAAPVSTASSSQVRRPINEHSVGAWQKYAQQLRPLQSKIDAALPAMR
ncbi:MAG: sulfotransferase [Lysobacter sp.]|nr:sulfotransferase [Lysobacter sp.]